ncbi:hypothetical protein RAJCM14343_5283 [Rhodococcus aetherivorans]|uniref:Uncharacterized protein n=1 Tax=Rhodococcus aetherivorans TaxID=191292 RepID=A0ABQ0YU04_9NOCA|nr:hypothetical protein RAJCM14343_5283 [Rhodococcus aetherivorans]
MRINIDRRDGESLEVERRRGQVLERQHHLEQRMARLRPRRVEHLDQPLERHIRVSERTEVDLSHPGEQIREGLGGLDPGTQDEGIDEHADQIVQFGLAAASDRRADHHVVRAGHASQQQRERGVHHHERRRVPGQRHLVETGGDRRVDPRDPRGPAVRRARRARPVAREFELLGDPGEHRAPVLELPRGEGVGIGLVAEDFALPQRVVRVLYRQRLPARHFAAAARRVGDHDVARERSHGETVRRDVMHHQHQHVFAFAQAQQANAQRHRRRDVEAGRRDRHHGVEQPLRADLLDDLIDRGLLDRQHPLAADAVDLGVDGAQHLMPGQHVADRGAQHVDVQCAGKPNCRRDVVRRRGRVEPVEEPHPLLRERERHLLRARPRHQRRPRTRARVRLQPGRQDRHSRCLEQHPHWHLRVERLTESRGDLGGDQRVAAETEEVVVDTYPLDPEHLGEHRGHDLLDRRSRCPEHLHLEHRCGQRPPVELARGIDGQGLERHDGVGHHVRRHQASDLVLQRRDVHSRSVVRHDVAHQLLSQFRVADHHDRLSDARLRGQC